MFELSITGITWLTASLASFVFASRFVVGKKKLGGIATYLVLGFSLGGVAFLFFSATLLTTNPATISMVHFIGHIILYLGLIFIAYVPIKVNEDSIGKTSSLLPPLLIVFGGSLQLYLEERSSMMPEVVELAVFSFVRWNLDFGSVFLFLVILWGVCLTTALSLIKYTKDFSKKERIYWMIFAVSLVVAATGGTLSSAALQPDALVLTETVVAFFAFSVVFAVAFFIKPFKELG